MKTLSAVRAFRARPMTAVAAVFAMAVLGNAVLVGCGKKAENTSSTTETTPTPAVETPAPPPGVAPPPVWGDPNVVRERLGSRVRDIVFDRARMSVPALSPQQSDFIVRAGDNP